MAITRKLCQGCLLGLVLFSCLAKGVFGARRVLAGPHAVFDVSTFGAKPDDKTDNFPSFVKAWKAACNTNGPEKVVIPKGNWLCGPVIFQGPCTATELVIEVLGIVKATTDITEYPDKEWVLFEKVNGLLLTGGGTFDGQGFSVWKFNDCKKNDGCQLPPCSLKFRQVNNSAIQGITSLNSMSFHTYVHDCENFTASEINITAPNNSPNTDGMHISQSKLVKVTNSVIGTGDDCISIGQGSTNVTISGVTCGPGHGISIGSLGKYTDEMDVQGITVTNCTLRNTTNGARIKTWPGSSPSLASDITYDNIIMDTVKNPILIDQHYGQKRNPAPSKVKISNVHFRNIRGTSVSNLAIAFNCSSAVPCEGIDLADIDFTYNGAKEDTSITASCSNAKITTGGKVNPPTSCQ